MKKVVYNTCYGGFGLSPLAQKEYAKLNGIELTFYKRTKYSFNEGKDEFVKVFDIENYNSHQLDASIKDLGDIIEEIPGEYFYYPDIERTDLNLITVVERLGSKANGACANLAIAEVEGKWRIDEYDGSESVETPNSYDWND